MLRSLSLAQRQNSLAPCVPFGARRPPQHPVPFVTAPLLPVECAVSVVGETTVLSMCAPADASHVVHALAVVKYGKRGADQLGASAFDAFDDFDQESCRSYAARRRVMAPAPRSL